MNLMILKTTIPVGGVDFALIGFAYHHDYFQSLYGFDLFANDSQYPVAGYDFFAGLSYFVRAGDGAI